MDNFSTVNPTILVSQADQYQNALDQCNQALIINPSDAILLTNKAKLLNKLGRYDEALEFADKSLEQNSNYHSAKIAKANSLNGQGAKLFVEGQFEQALDKYEQALIINPSDGILSSNKTQLLIKLERYDKALEFADKFLEQNPNFPLVKQFKVHALNGQGNKLFVEGQFEQALDKYEQALIINPSDSILLSNMAQLLTKLGIYKEALEFADKSLQENPNFLPAKTAKAIALNELGLKLVAEGQLKQALNKYDQALSIAPSIIILSNKANLLNKLGRHDEAFYYADKSLEQDPNYPPANEAKANALNGQALELLVVVKGQFHINDGKYKQALDKYEQALNIYPDNNILLSNKAQTLVNLRRYDEALNFANKYLEQDPNNPAAKTAKAKALNGQGYKLANEGKFELAINKYEQAIILTPDDKLVLSNKAELLNRLGRYDEALDFANKSLEQDQNNPAAKTTKAEALNQQGIKLLKEGKFEGALNKFDEALSINSSNSILISNKADVLNKLERYEEALEFANKSLEIWSYDSSSRALKIVALNGQGTKFLVEDQFEQAIKKYEQALIFNNSNYIQSDSILLSNTAHALIKLEKYDKALGFADLSLGQDQKFLPAKTAKFIALNAQGFKLLKEGQFEQALDKFDKALSVTPNDKITLLRKAIAFNKLGRYDEALEFVNKSLEQDQNYTLAKTFKAVALNIKWVELIAEDEHSEIEGAESSSIGIDQIQEDTNMMGEG